MRLPGRCVVCRRDVVWTGRQWKDGANLRRRHVCPAERPVCGARMIYEQRCARRPGHTTEHRTAYALANAARSKRIAA